LGVEPMMRGQALLVVGFLVVAMVTAITVYLLKTLTALSGGIVFLLAALVAIAAFVIYGYVVTKLGY
jgi:hypothetical protein